MRLRRVRCIVLIALAPLGCATLSTTYVEPNLLRGEAAVLAVAPYIGRSIQISQIDGKLVGLTNRAVSNYWKKRMVERMFQMGVENIRQSRIRPCKMNAVLQTADCCLSSRASISRFSEGVTWGCR